MMRRGITIFAMTAAVLALAVPGVPAQSKPCRDVDVAAVDNASRAKAEKALRCLIDRQRSARGARKLSGNGKLAKAARGHARDMDRNDYFSHSSRSGRSAIERVRRTGYLKGARNWRVGEAIAFRLSHAISAQDILAEFLRSRQHTRVLRSNAYRHIGLGWSAGAPVADGEGETVVAVLGRR